MVIDPITMGFLCFVVFFRYEVHPFSSHFLPTHSPFNCFCFFLCIISMVLFLAGHRGKSNRHHTHSNTKTEASFQMLIAFCDTCNLILILNSNLELKFSKPTAHIHNSYTHTVWIILKALDVENKKKPLNA